MLRLFQKLNTPNSNIAAFLVVGVVGLMADMGCYALASLWLPSGAARVVSIVCAITVTWQMNRRYSFRPHAEKTLFQEYLHYFVASLCGAGVNYLTFLTLISLLPDNKEVEYLAICVSSAVAAAVNFLLYKHKVFAK